MSEYKHYDKIKDIISNEIEALKNIKTIAPDDPPDIYLYMDQVTAFLREHLMNDNVHDDDKLLTKTMINNYTKKKLLPPPIKKKYSKQHLYFLTLIYYYKNFLTIDEIHDLLAPITEKYSENDPLTIEYTQRYYSKIYEMYGNQQDGIVADIKDDLETVRKMIEETKNEEEIPFSDEVEEYLELLLLVTVLSNDIYYKKVLIENLIGNFAQLKKDRDKKNKEKEKKRNNYSDSVNNCPSLHK